MSRWRRHGAPEADENILARSLATHLGRGVHPLVANIMAYEDATGTASACFRARDFAPSPTNVRREVTS